MLEGVGVNVETETNTQGGKQSKTPYRFDLIEPKAVFKLAKVLSEGAEKYGERNWIKIKTDSHLNHALMHIFAFLAGDGQDEHLEHAFTKLMFAIYTSEEIL